tara:strand:+ start:1631 stop:1975 length:345 start_codon:yes stop_codon:yes gene_type:complete
MGNGASKSIDRKLLKACIDLTFDDLEDDKIYFKTELYRFAIKNYSLVSKQLTGHTSTQFTNSRGNPMLRMKSAFPETLLKRYGWETIHRATHFFDEKGIKTTKILPKIRRIKNE